MGENHRYRRLCLLSYYIKKIFITYCIGVDSYYHACTHLKEATTSIHSLAPIGRELQSPDLVNRFLPEGSTYPLNKFTSYNLKEDLTPILKVPTLNSSHEPRFIIFHTRSTYLKYTSKHVGHLSSNFHRPPFIKFSHYGHTNNNPKPKCQTEILNLKI